MNPLHTFSTPKRRLPCSPTLLAAALSTALLAGCGGGGDDAASGSSMSFPTGLAVGSPTELGDAVAGQNTASAARTTIEALRHAWAAWRRGDSDVWPDVLTALLPIGGAQADGAVGPAIASKAALIASVLEGDPGVTLADVLDPSRLFGASGHDASCYGPSIAYASHQDAGGSASGNLPTGDLGLWRETEGDTTPCVAAQLEARVDGVEGQTRQALLMVAVMRMTIAKSATLSLPAAGATVDITSEFAGRVAAVFSPLALQVQQATVALDADGTYTYRLVVGNAETGADYRLGEVVMRHTPGDTAQVYQGLLRVAGFAHGADAAFGCTDQKTGDNAWFKTARVATVAYRRDGDAVSFGSRASSYCGHPSDTAADDLAGQVASFTADGQLDPSVSLGMGSTTRGSTLGWRGNFERFAGDHDRSTVAGNFVYAWQAGTGDSNARALAARAEVASGTRTVTGWFGYAAPIATTDGSLLGMICNWAGPGNSHTPQPLFQSQVATMAAGASAYAVGATKIRYAPTVSCSSTTTSYDVNADNALDIGEGVAVLHDLDGLTGSNATVGAEIGSRGWAAPGLF